MTFGTNAILEITGNFTNNAGAGIMSLSNSTIRFTGAGASTLVHASGSPGTNFARLIIAKTSGAALTCSTGTMGINTLLRLENSNLSLGTSASLVLNANSNSTAYIDLFTPTTNGTITGSGAANVSVNQYILDYTDINTNCPYPTNFRYFGSPVSSNTWHSNFAIDPSNSACQVIPYYVTSSELDPCGVYSASYDTPAEGYSRWYTPSPIYWNNGGTPGFWRYDEPYEDPNTGGDEGWYGHVSIQSSTSITRKLEGLLTHFRIATGNTNRLITWKGAVNLGTLTETFTRTINNINGSSPITVESANGFQIGGNPYPCALSWDKVIDNNAGNTNVNPTVCIWRNQGDFNNIGTSYCYNALTNAATDGTKFNGDLAIGQGFQFVMDATGSLTVKPADCMAPTTTTKFNRTSVDYKWDMIGLSINSGKHLTDYLNVAYSEGFTNELDLKYDFPKSRKNTHVNFTSNKGQSKLVFKHAPYPSELGFENLELQLKEAGLYTFTAKDFRWTHESLVPYFVDLKEGKVMEVNSSFTYTTSMEEGNHTDRFSLVFTASGLPSIPSVMENKFDFNWSLESNKMEISLKNITEKTVKYEMTDISGRIIKAGIHNTESSESLSFSVGSAPKGIFILRFFNGGSIKSKKVYIP